MNRAPLLMLSLLALAACGRSETNAPTDPAQPVATPAADATALVPAPGHGAVSAGTGPQSFVGRWAANVAWCPNVQGAERAIEITTTRLEGYENSCAIGSVDQQGDGYVVALRCTADGATTNERVRLAASGQTLIMTWLERDNARVELTKCTTLGDTPRTGPSLKLD